MKSDNRGLWHAKRVDNGEWVEGFLAKRTKSYAKIVDDEDIVWYVDPSTLGECTGLPDKNHKLIFEGDITKAKWQHLSNTDTVIGVVKYDDAAFILETDNHYLFFEDNIFSYECEVIGNVYDNPELLKGATGDDAGNAAQDTLLPAT